MKIISSYLSSRSLDWLILVTQKIQNYVLFYQHRENSYEIHLIDSSDFDDDSMMNAEILFKIANYVNTNYKLKKRLTEVLYLHNIIKDKVEEVKQRNIRMLENMIDDEKFENCILVIIKWDCSKLDEENVREEILRSQKKYFDFMLQNENQNIHHSAVMTRFELKIKDISLSIIHLYLENKFISQIFSQMIDLKSLRLVLSEIEADKVVANNLEKLAQTKQEMIKVQATQKLLRLKYDETLFEEFKQKRKKLRRRIVLQRFDRWIMRITIIESVIVVTILTLDSSASTFALKLMYEKTVREQRRNEKRAKVQLKEKFKNRSKYVVYLQNKNSSWLRINKIQNMKNLNDETFNIKSESSENILAVTRKEENLSVVIDERKIDDKTIETTIAEMLINKKVAISEIEIKKKMTEIIEKSEDSESESDSSN